MKVLVTRTSGYNNDIKPIDECETQELAVHYLDYRTSESIAEAKKSHWFESWYRSGLNHREENGRIVCDVPRIKVLHFIEVSTLTDIIALHKKYGDIIVKKSDYKEFEIELEIYDYYRV